MAYFSSLQNFIDTVTARFNKPRRSLTNEGILKEDVLQALIDTAKRSEDVREEANLLNSNFVSRSLNLTATIYVDGVNGNDARTGTTNDSNAATGRVKTLTRVAQLYSGKVSRLYIVIVGSLTHTVDVTLDIFEVTLHVSAGTSLTFSKRSLGATGECNYKLNLKSSHVHVFNQGTVNVEAHAAPPGSPTEFYYYAAQGAICLLKANSFEYEAPKSQFINVIGGTINVGDYTTFVVAGRDAGGSNPLARYSSPGNNVATTVVLGTNATLHDLIGDRLGIRQYTPVSSTDSNILEREMTSDANFLYRKSGGVIKKIAWTSL